MVAAANTEASPPAAAAGPATAPAVSAGGGFKAWLPSLVALLAAPAACWTVAQFVLMPQLERSLSVAPVDGAPAEAAPAPGPASAPASAPASPSGHGPKPGAAAAGNSYRFENVVVNLAGTMGTRYLKTTFLVTGGDTSNLAARFEAARPQLLDVSLSVLSSLTLHDLEEPGAKNVIRQKLVNSYNQALGQRVAEQVYFSDFVVQ